MNTSENNCPNGLELPLCKVWNPLTWQSCHVRGTYLGSMCFSSGAQRQTCRGWTMHTGWPLGKSSPKSVWKDFFSSFSLPNLDGYNTSLPISPSFFWQNQRRQLLFKMSLSHASYKRHISSTLSFVFFFSSCGGRMAITWFLPETLSL